MAEKKAAPQGPKRKRAPRGTRRDLIIDGALKVFSEKGFSAGTREIAASLGVTQALLYRYFDSKDALIDAVFERQSRQDVTLPSVETLLDRRAPLEDRVERFAADLLDVIKDDRMRLSLYAGLAGYGDRHLSRDQLVNEVIGPLVLAARLELGLPDFSERPITAQEFDLAMILHGGLVCLAIRDLIYDAGPFTSPANAVSLLASAFVSEARQQLAQVHSAWGEYRPIPGRQPVIAAAS